MDASAPAVHRPTQRITAIGPSIGSVLVCGCTTGSADASQLDMGLAIGPCKEPE